MTARQPTARTPAADRGAALRDLFELSPDLICTHDLDGTILSANPAACASLGYELEELVGTNLSDLLAENAQKLFTSYIDTLVATGCAMGRMEVRARDGERRMWEYRNVVLSGPRPVVGGIARDVTERARTVRTLYESEAHFRSLVENGSDVICIISPDGVICYHSPAAVHALRYAPQDLLGKPFVDFVHADDREALCGVMSRECDGTSGVERVEIRLRNKSGSWRSFEAVVKPITRGSTVTGLLLNARDITERKMLEQQLEQAHRVDSLGRLAATVAHEFNNVLMGMMPFAELLQRRAPTPELIARATQHLINSIHRGKRVTHDILRYTQPAEPAIQPVALDGWWSGFLAEAQVLMGDPIRIRSSIEPLTVMADPSQLSQVFANLMTNARDAMRGGGELAVHVRAPENGEVFSFGYVPDPTRFVHLSVADTGCGMTPEVLRHVFDPLFTTKPNGGTGLGLAVTHQVVTRHGGYIFAESVVGEGSTFHLFLPRGEASQAAPPPSRATHRLRARRLLLVDDEEAITEGVEALLGDAGFETVVASSGAEALRLVGDASVDVVLLDIGLPDIDGTEVARRIHELRPALPVILMTGHGDARQEKMLRKPFEIEALLERIAEMERP